MKPLIGKNAATPLRRILFWLHLAAGVLCGVIVLFMSATGVLLTYEHAMLRAAADAVRVEAPTGAERVPLDAVAQGVAGERPVGLRLPTRAEGAFLVQGRGVEPRLIDPYTGETIESSLSGMESFFSQVARLHRWFGLEGEGRDVGRALTGAANLAFLFLIVSGLVLWLPRTLRWPLIRRQVAFQKGAPDGRARDYNWHHVFGFWSLVPLFVIVTTGVVMSYPWANNALYAAFGETPPQRGGPPRAGGGGETSLPQAGPLVSLEEAAEVVRAASSRWTAIDLSVPPAGAQTRIAEFTVHTGDRTLPQQRRTVRVDRADGTIVSEEGYDPTPAGRARTFVRFGHTGEAFGLIGSTVAGLSSIGACFLVWTGFALAWRRLVPAKR
ncbi:PepSY-associated TM helix domain-containing protein [Parvularcula dongshanensis]|uniref:Putative iron-regulated membrane protein n=1 Tax=Parvularcula dongshanensis TaxID=1173995 RepID=A0A840I559_9PROT|nr:PepSY-associated TM helix domain-containing protein [Parvularcula dongshanensis]MBB4659465.1 putative iron-regulated membrane protein [Parvularcula dongshanensis]